MHATRHEQLIFTFDTAYSSGERDDTPMPFPTKILEQEQEKANEKDLTSTRNPHEPSLPLGVSEHPIRKKPTEEKPSLSFLVWSTCGP